MKITTWNARGLNAPSKKRLLKHNLKQFKSEIVMIQETKLKEEGIKLEKILGNWNVNLLESRGASGGLGMIQNPRKVSLNVIHSNNSWMSSIIKSIKNELTTIFNKHIWTNPKHR